MTKFLAKFRRDEDGAVTVDWVVLTAAIVGLGIAVISTVAGGASEIGSNISDHLSSQTMVTY
jgi:Flp pilus assembly pilin Flp